jgi:hypothetical protein
MIIPSAIPFTALVTLGCVFFSPGTTLLEAAAAGRTGRGAFAAAFRGAAEAAAREAGVKGVG